MDLKDIKAIIDLMKKNSVTEFELEKQDFKIRLKRGSNGGGAAQTYDDPPLVAYVQPMPGIPAPAPTAISAQAANSELTELLGKGLASDVLTQSLKYITFTNDPIASSLNTDAQHAVSVGLLKPVNLSGIYDLGPINKLLQAEGQPQVNS